MRKWWCLKTVLSQLLPPLLNRGIASRQVVLLSGVQLQIVQFFLCAFDVPEPAISECRENIPTELVMAVEGFGVDDPTWDGMSVEQRLQRAATQSTRVGCFGEVQQRWHQIEMLDCLLDSAAGAFSSRLLDDEWNPEPLFVNEPAVFLLAVLPESLAVIGDEDDRRAVVQLMGLQIADQTPDDLVGPSDLGVIRRVDGPTFERHPSRVWLKDMKEEERAGRSRPFEPLLGQAG